MVRWETHPKYHDMELSHEERHTEHASRTHAQTSDSSRRGASRKRWGSSEGDCIPQRFALPQAQPCSATELNSSRNETGLNQLTALRLRRTRGSGSASARSAQQRPRTLQHRRCDARMTSKTHSQAQARRHETRHASNPLGVAPPERCHVLQLQFRANPISSLRPAQRRYMIGHTTTPHIAN